VVTDHDRFVARLWQIYDLYRTLAMNRKYYGLRLEQVRKRDRRLQFALAAGTSSGLAGWLANAAGWGTGLWTILTGAAILAGVLVPVLDYASKIERYSKLHADYSMLCAQLQRVVAEIEARRTITEDMEATVNRAQLRFSDLSVEDDPAPDEELLRACQAAVNREIPVDRLWLPFRPQMAPHAA